MKTRYSLIFAGLGTLVCSAFLACSRIQTQSPEPEPQLPVFGEDVVRGELLVRFDEGVAALLEESGLTKSGPSNVLTACEIPSVEEVLAIVGNYSIERVFPLDVRREELSRREGLHLWYRVRFDEDAPMEQVYMELSRLGEVSSVNCNRRLKKAYSGKSVPFHIAKTAAASVAAGNWNDELFPYQWHLVNRGDLGESKFSAGADVNVEQAWELSSGDPSIIVAVLDEGVDYTHPDLKDAMWVNEDEIWRSREDNDGNGYAGDVYGYNFSLGTSIISTDDVNDSGHGCHVAGVIAATNNNGLGISSIAGGDGSNPGVRIMSCQIFSGVKGGTVLDEVRAIKYAADNGATVLQCSWGYTSGAANAYDWQPMYSSDEAWMADNALERKALDYFIHNAGSPDGVVEGGIAVFAGGNESAPAAGYPGAYGDFVSVAATAADWTPAVYTNYGPGTTISAPGGDQDYYWNYGEGSERGTLGCVLSTLPLTVSPSGYGYMEGTSMACPHVSGVVALGLSYAARLHRHFKASEIIDLLYSSATPVEQYWNIDEPKYYYKYVTDLGTNYRNSMDLRRYAGGMGSGQVNASAFLRAIEGSGVEMTFPNVTVAPGSSVKLALRTYFDNLSGASVKVDDGSIAEASIVSGKLVVKGLAEGQSSAVISADGKSHRFVVSVRSNLSEGGWL
ncbi:MAG: S8 family serine peptidase [Bacteroidales bacterium]|nr:S8 family serine peptidase [Bacteroidales bacterium]